MIAKSNLPNSCGSCGHKIMKGQKYIYREKKRYPNGYLYFHSVCH